MTRGPYQLLPPLSEDEYAALRDDIKSAGVRVPIDVDENGAILDGHHRKAIAEELGVECPERVVRDLPEFAKVDYALSVNLARRHLTNEQKSKLAQASLKRDPGLSDREHARRCGVSRSFVAGLRAVMEDDGKIEPRTVRTGADGKEYPTPHAPQVAAAATSPATEAPADRQSRSDQPVVPDSRSETEAAAGPDPRPAAAEQEERKPAPWTPEERRAHEEEVQLQKDRESAHTYAERFVTQVRTYVVTIVAGYRLGERGLLTLDDIAAARKSLDMLEKEVLADAQR